METIARMECKMGSAFNNSGCEVHACSTISKTSIATIFRLRNVRNQPPPKGREGGRDNEGAWEKNRGNERGKTDATNEHG